MVGFQDKTVRILKDNKEVIKQLSISMSCATKTEDSSENIYVGT